MNSTLLTKATAVFAVAGALVLGLTAPASARSTAPCSSAGVSADDNSLASQLRAQISWMTGYRMSCARAVARQVKSRGLDLRALQIAFTTVVTETHFDNISVAEDADSLGLFQQRPSMGWGTPAQLTDPAYATNAFLNAMNGHYPNNAWQGGDIPTICQKIQKSAFPDGSNYRASLDQATTIANFVWSRMGKPSSHDFNNDGKTDLAAIDPEGTMVLFVGDGAGRVNYGNAMSGKGHWIGQRLLAAGDFNGDAKIDIAAVSPSGTMELYTGNGAGDLGYSNAMSGAGHWAGQKAIAAGDFNGDGKTDIAAISAEGTMELYAGNGAGGLGYSNAMSGTGHWAGQRLITAADYNGDSKTDVAGIDADGNLAYYAGNGAGGLGWGGPMWNGAHWASHRAIV
ncbi:VCBS repeat protein [Lentzea atacamensis]|uniref:VCBS repeat protein n=1 Tax=Lentzea atacamensis TaxID=531938 RepID=A0A316IBD2_9PSEU|nr:VCBS repeat-containing protein [Lentzea atacamensis]PWK90837.1 VCBS repeat protein [Lentzea atacamensis]